jgi:stage V sporulation protein T
MPVTDASKKVRSVIKRRQEDGKWICAVPYGYVITDSKGMKYESVPAEAEVIRKIFELYIDGWGYKRIANYLTEKNIPTPRMCERSRKEASGDECRIKAAPRWSIVTIQGIITNDFYVGTLRQGKYRRRKINGEEIKTNESDHIVFENSHEAIIDLKTFNTAKDALIKRTTSSYRGIKKYDNVYSGLMRCGDCGSPMFSMSRGTKEAYRCGAYHQRGLKGCTSHYISADVLDCIMRAYLQKVRDTSADMILRLKKSIEGKSEAKTSGSDVDIILEGQISGIKEERKMYLRQKAREIMRRPEHEESIEQAYDELLNECDARIEGLKNQIEFARQRQDAATKSGKLAKQAFDIFDEILKKNRLTKSDVELIIDKIYIYEDHIHVKLKSDIECILKSGKSSCGGNFAANFNQGIIDSLAMQTVLHTRRRKDKVYDVNIICEGDPLEIYTDREGEVIFKKYSPIGELADFAAQYAETLHRTCGIDVVICDRDAVTASAGLPKKEYIDRKLSYEFEEIIENRQFYSADKGGTVAVIDGGSRFVSCAMPIISDGDVTGCVASMFPANDEARALSEDVEAKLIQTAASFLGRQLEA